MRGNFNTFRYGSESFLNKAEEQTILAKRKLFHFVEYFLGWYRNSFGKSEVENHLNLLEVVKEAEDIYMDLIRENEKIAQKNHKKLIEALTPKKAKKKARNLLRT